MMGPIPSWFCFLQAWCYFAYRMLDEMDGKQARRTGNSSPLGLIFDHGCDAFSTGFVGIIFLRICQVGNNALSFIGLITLYASFHFATIEEHYLGTLRLPPLNAVSDGSVIAIAFCIFSGIYGCEVWAIPVCDGRWLHIDGITTLTIGQLIIVVGCGVATLTYMTNWLRILYSKKYPAST